MVDTVHEGYLAWAIIGQNKDIRHKKVSKLNKNVRNVKTHSGVFLSKDIIYMYKKKKYSYYLVEMLLNCSSLNSCMRALSALSFFSHLIQLLFSQREFS